MKKLLGIVVLGLLLSGNAFAEKINLSCTEKITNTVLSFTIDTDVKKVSTQGSNYDPYLYSNGVFTFMMKDEKNDYLYRLNRNTGILIVKAWKKNEEEREKLTAEIYLNMLADGKTIDDTDYVLNLYLINIIRKKIILI
jgi:hypothetical protein